MIKKKSGSSQDKQLLSKSTKEEKNNKHETKVSSTSNLGFFKSSFEELKKVSFPTRQETVQTSAWTLMFVVAFAILLSLLDVLFRYLIFWLI
jgi:preprotein translocase SecE subunit